MIDKYLIQIPQNDYFYLNKCVYLNKVTIINANKD